MPFYFILLYRLWRQFYLSLYCLYFYSPKISHTKVTFKIWIRIYMKQKTLSTITSHQRSILNKNKAVACYGDFTVQSSQIKQCNILILMPYLLKMFPFALYISSLKFSLIVHLKNERIVLYYRPREKKNSLPQCVLRFLLAVGWKA